MVEAVSFLYLLGSATLRTCVARASSRDGHRHDSPQQAQSQPWVTLLQTVVSLGVTARLHAQVRAAQQGHQRGHRARTAGACAPLRLAVQRRQKLHSCRQGRHSRSRQTCQARVNDAPAGAAVPIGLQMHTLVLCSVAHGLYGPC